MSSSKNSIVEALRSLISQRVRFSSSFYLSSLGGAFEPRLFLDFSYLRLRAREAGLGFKLNCTPLHRKGEMSVVKD